MLINRKITYIILITFLLKFSVGLSQTDAAKSNSEFINSLKESGINVNVVNQVQLLLNDRDVALSTALQLKNSISPSYPIQFKDEEITEEYINKQFSRKLSGILTINDFTKAFRHKLGYQIDRDVNKKWQTGLSKYKLTKEQGEKYKKLLLENTEREIMVREYYNYDESLSWNSLVEEKLLSESKERNFLQRIGIIYSKDNKTDYLIDRLKSANIDNERIILLLQAIANEEQRQDKRLKTWRENNYGYIVHFHDAGDTEDQIRMDLRQEISKILNYEEFKNVFINQLQNRITRDSQKEFNQVKSAYQQLTQEQTNLIMSLVNDKSTEKIVTEEYYKYNWDLSQQKLRAVEFRHEKAIRETLQKFNIAKP